MTKKFAAGYRYPYKGKYAFFGIGDTVDAETAQVAEPLFVDGDGISQFKAQVIGMQKAVDRIEGYIAQNGIDNKDIGNLLSIIKHEQRGLIWADERQTLETPVTQEADAPAEQAAWPFNEHAWRFKPNDRLIPKAYHLRGTDRLMRVIAIQYNLTDKLRQYLVADSMRMNITLLVDAETIEAMFLRLPRPSHAYDDVEPS